MAAHSSTYCSSVLAGAPLWTDANCASGTEVVNASRFESTTSRASVFPDIISLMNAGGATAYPIASFTWLLVPAKPSDAAKGKRIADFLRWAMTDGQKEATALDYAPLPASLATRLLTRIDSIAPGGSR